VSGWLPDTNMPAMPSVGDRREVIRRLTAVPITAIAQHVRQFLLRVAASTRTRLRTGKRSYLEKVENFGQTAYYVGGPNPAHRQSFDDQKTAIDWFEGVEKGDRPERF
jgi:hypothetical protein